MSERLEPASNDGGTRWPRTRKLYIRFEIEKRRFSADCVVGIYHKEVEKKINGKTEIVAEERRDRILAPFSSLAKQDGDETAKNIMLFLNGQLPGIHIR